MTTRPRFAIDKKSSSLVYIHGHNISVHSLDKAFHPISLKNDTSSPFTCVAIFSDPNPTCVVSNLEKALYIFDVQNGVLVSKLKTSKRVMDLQYSPCNQSLYIADKFGDVYSLKQANFNSENKDAFKLEAGHLGSLTQLLISHNEKFMITSDRDEKIRISHFPNVYEIWNFCLGHTQAVTAICEVNTGSQSFLVSGALDNMLKIWDIYDENAPLRETIQVEGHPTQLRSLKDLLFVAFEKSNSISVYQINEEFRLQPLDERTIRFDSEILHFEIYEHGNNQFLIVMLANSPNFKVVNITYEEYKIEETFSSLSDIAFTFTPDESTYISTLKKQIGSIKQKKVPHAEQ